MSKLRNSEYSFRIPSSDFRNSEFKALPSCKTNKKSCIILVVDMPSCSTLKAQPDRYLETSSPLLKGYRYMLEEFHSMRCRDSILRFLRATEKLSMQHCLVDTAYLAFHNAMRWNGTHTLVSRERLVVTHHVIWGPNAGKSNLLLVARVLRNAKVSDQNALVFVEEKIARLQNKKYKSTVATIPIQKGCKKNVVLPRQLCGSYWHGRLLLQLLRHPMRAP